MHRSTHRIAVVFNDVDNRQVPERGHIETFIDLALVGRTITEIGQADVSVVVVIVVELALITPPMGINVFVIRGLSQNVSLATIFRGVLPFCLSLLVVLGLVVFFPGLATFAIR